jgi:hypothetical protein
MEGSLSRKADLRNSCHRPNPKLLPRIADESAELFLYHCKRYQYFGDLVLLRLLRHPDPRQNRDLRQVGAPQSQITYWACMSVKNKEVLCINTPSDAGLSTASLVHRPTTSAKPGPPCDGGR